MFGKKNATAVIGSVDHEALRIAREEHRRAEIARDLDNALAMDAPCNNTVTVNMVAVERAPRKENIEVFARLIPVTTAGGFAEYKVNFATALWMHQHLLVKQYSVIDGAGMNITNQVIVIR